jgi:hypothetical protein
VKLLKTNGEHLVFQLGRREKSLLLDLIKLYPLVPPAHHQLRGAGTSPETQGDQHLLDEALAEHRAENRRQVDALLQDPERFKEEPDGYRLHLSTFQLEWLLQVLNDVRVGAWLHLGSPDGKTGKRVRPTLKNARYLWAMEISGVFQHALMSGRDQG